MKAVKKETWKKNSQQSINTGQSRATAAVMFTDVVGYTVLMEKDQQEALALLNVNRNLHKYHISVNRGTWIKEMGDGILVRFSSADDAVKCALDIQTASKNVRGLQLHIGIHFGEVICIENDVFGMVVNIASRLQCLAKPGQILVSSSVAGRITAESSCQVNVLGNRRLKNVKQTVKVHCIGNVHETTAFKWWSFHRQFPVQQAMSLVLMLASQFRI